MRNHGWFHYISLVGAGLDRAAAATLVNVGAVYIDKVLLNIPVGTLVTQMREGVLQVRAESGALEQVIPKDTYLRVHSHPRRFPIATTTDWASRVVASSPHFVVLDKPGGVPIHRTLDNATETAEVCTARALNTRLWALHRLDVSALARPPHSTFALDPIRTPCRPPRRLSPPGLAPARRATKL